MSIFTTSSSSSATRGRTRGRTRCRTRSRPLLAAGILAAACALAPGAPAEAGQVGIQFAAGGQFRVAVTSLKEARFKTVIKQRYDFSCGSAALASLLTYHYERPTTEEDLFRAMYIAGDKERIHASGFSLLDMKTYLAEAGLNADGYQIPLDKLAAAQVPAITLINTNGYKHFVLIKGIRGDEVVIGDPAAGVRIYSQKAFAEMWEGIAFIIRDEADLARRHFNSERDWAVRVKAPFGTALGRQSLASFNVNLPAAIGRF